MRVINSDTGFRFVTAKAIVACMLVVAAGACQKAPAPGSDQSASAASSAAPAAAPPEVETAPPSTAPVAQSVPPPVAPSSATPPAGPAVPQTAPAVAPAPVVKPIVIPAGTHLTVRLERTLGSATSAAGENFTATLVNGVTIQGAPAIPRHAPVVGKVVDAKAAGKFAGDASLGLRLESVADRAVVTSTYSRRVQGKGKRTAAVIGGTAVAGALLGALAGHGRGAAIGAVAGGGVGTLGAAETGNNRDIVLPAGTVLTFKLRHAISLEPQP
jgi:hypothetical protein